MPCHRPLSRGQPWCCTLQMLYEAARSFPGGEQPPEQPRGRSRKSRIYSQPRELGAILGSVRGPTCRAWFLVPRVYVSPPSPSDRDACCQAREFCARLGLNGNTQLLQRFSCFLGPPAAPGSAGLPLRHWQLGRGPGGHSRGTRQGVCSLQSAGFLTASLLSLSAEQVPLQCMHEPLWRPAGAGDRPSQAGGGRAAGWGEPRRADGAAERPAQPLGLAAGLQPPGPAPAGNGCAGTRARSWLQHLPGPQVPADCWQGSKCSCWCL